MVSDNLKRCASYLGSCRFFHLAEKRFLFLVFYTSKRIPKIISKRQPPRLRKNNNGDVAMHLLLCQNGSQSHQGNAPYKSASDASRWSAVASQPSVSQSHRASEDSLIPSAQSAERYPNYSVPGIRIRAQVSIAAQLCFETCLPLPRGLIHSGSIRSVGMTFRTQQLLVRRLQ